MSNRLSSRKLHIVLAALFGASAALAALPAGYTEVIYIASSGTQYIDTGVVPSSTTRVVCDFSLTAMPTDRVRNGWASAGSQEAFWFGTDNDHVNFSCSVSGNSVQSNTGVPVDTARHTFDISTSAIKFDGATVANPAAAFTDAASGNTMYLFASNQGWNPSIGAPGKMEIYSCQIYSGDALVRDFVPARRESDGAEGLFDRENSNFHAFDLATKYYIIAGADLEGVSNSSISGGAFAAGWATQKGATVKATDRMTAENAIYYVWTNRSVRSPQGANFTSMPASSSVVVEESVTWAIADKMTGHTLALNNVVVREGGAVKIVPVNDAAPDCVNTIAGSFALEEGATLQLSASKEEQSAKKYVLSASVTGRGAILMPSTASANAFSGILANRITGDISGFTGDIGTWNGYNAVSLELVNAASIPGDPAAGQVACVIVTNGATLKIDHDWTSPKNRVWILGDGARPTINVAEGVTVEILGALRGTSGFLKAGPGTLVLGGDAAALSGPMEIMGGKVVLKGKAVSLKDSFTRAAAAVSLPAGYTLLDHLYLKGGGTASYIDTGFTPTTATFGFLFDYMPTNVVFAAGTGARVMGSSVRDNGNWGGVTMSNWADNSSATGQFVFGSVINTIPVVGGQASDTRMIMSLMNGVAQLSSGWSRTIDLSTVDTSKFYGSIYIGTIHTETITAGAPMRVYCFKIYEGGTLVHDFVPVSGPEGVGLYDVSGDKGFRPAADAQYVSAGPAYSGSDDEWLEVATGPGLTILVR